MLKKYIQSLVPDVDKSCDHLIDHIVGYKRALQVTFASFAYLGNFVDDDCEFYDILDYITSQDENITAIRCNVDTHYSEEGIIVKLIKNKYGVWYYCYIDSYTQEIRYIFPCFVLTPNKFDTLEYTTQYTYLKGKKIEYYEEKMHSNIKLSLSIPIIVETTKYIIDQVPCGYGEEKQYVYLKQRDEKYEWEYGIRLKKIMNNIKFVEKHIYKSMEQYTNIVGLDICDLTLEFLLKIENDNDNDD